MRLRGRVIKKLRGKGTRSEHQAVYLSSPRGDFKLRLQGANPFHDPALERLVGKSISATGEVDKDSNEFYASDWKEVTPAKPRKADA